MRQPTHLDESGPDAALERIKVLEQQRALEPVNSQQHRALRAAIRMEADAYRRFLDIEQASAIHGVYFKGRKSHSQAR
jgi:hypothetical protein